MEANWIKVLETEDLIKAKLAKNALKANQIESAIIDKQDSAYVVLGFAEVCVPEIKAEAATAVLKEQDLF